RTMAASVQQRMACGERAGQRVRRIGAGFGSAGEVPTLTGPRCASVQGFSLHANTDIPAHRRDQLERLIRYTARGAVSLERLQAEATGDLVYTFTHPWSDGTTGMRLSPLELLRSSRRWSPCHTSIWCAMGAASRRTATCVGRSVPHHANRGWSGRKRKLAPHTGTGPSSWGVSLAWRWPHVPFAVAAHSGLLP